MLSQLVASWGLDIALIDNTNSFMVKVRDVITAGFDKLFGEVYHWQAVA